MNIVIRCDASKTLGTGHVMRCLTLAQELNNQHHNVTFVVLAHPDNLAAHIRAQGFICLEITTNKLNPQLLGENNWQRYPYAADWQETQKLLAATRIDWLIVDHYSLDNRWQALARTQCNRIFVIDDLKNRRHHCDGLLDQTLNRTTSDYKNLVPEHCKLFMGLKYALINASFEQFSPHAKANKQGVLLPKNLLINLGGADINNDTQLILSALVELQTKLTITIVVGGLYPHFEKLQQYCEQHFSGKVTILQNINNMAEVLTQMHIAIGAAGTSCYERVMLGVPSLIYSLASNQKDNIENISQAGLGINMGSMSQFTKLSLQQNLTKLMTQPNLYRDMVTACFEQSKTNGATTIANFITDHG